MRVLGVFEIWAGRCVFEKVNRRIRRNREREREREIAGYRKWPPLYARMPLPVLRSHSPKRRPGPPVKTGARVRRFRGCNIVNPRARALQAWLARPLSFFCSLSLLGFSPGDTRVLWGSGPAARLDAGGFACFCRPLSFVPMLNSQITNTKGAATTAASLAVVTAGGVLYMRVHAARAAVPLLALQ